MNTAKGALHRSETSVNRVVRMKPCLILAKYRNGFLISPSSWRRLSPCAEARSRNVTSSAVSPAVPVPATPTHGMARTSVSPEESGGERNLALLCRAIRRQVSRSEEARRCLHYFQTNRERMRYPEFHAQGLCTSTGIVEAGCKVAIGTRLKRAGMHWTVHGSNAIIALRCSKLSGRFQDFWERRTERRAA